MKIILINWVVKVKVGIKDRFMASFSVAVMFLFDDILLGE